MHSETLATFPNGNRKRSISLKNHFKTFEKRLQTLISIINFFSALGYIPTVLSRVEFGRVLLQLTRISRALLQKIKILRKFLYFPYFRSVDARFYDGRFTAQFTRLCTHKI